MTVKELIARLLEEPMDAVVELDFMEGFDTENTDAGTRPLMGVEGPSYGATTVWLMDRTEIGGPTGE